MSLLDRITNDIKDAMRAKDKIALEALRAAKTAFTIARTNKSADAVLTNDEELKIIQKLVKQRKESAIIYKEQNRLELYEKEIAEADVLEKYLPAQMSEDELIKVLKEIILEIGASAAKDIGRVMGVATKKLAGRADGKLISEKVRELLS